MRNLVLTGLAVAVGALATPAFAVNEGKAVGVDPQAVARVDNGERVLVAGADISVGETLVTGPKGQVQIIFADDTHMVVGPNSSLLIETYLMRNDGTAEKLAVNALAGSFRFITGHSPKPAYEINTPTAAIAVRGTEFDIAVTPTQTGVMLYGGALQLCSSDGDCKQVTARCEVGLSSAEQTDLIDRNNPQRTQLAREFFYAHFQSLLMSEFRVSGASQCLYDVSDYGAFDGGGSSSDTPTAPGAPAGRPPAGGPPAAGGPAAGGPPAGGPPAGGPPAAGGPRAGGLGGGGFGAVRGGGGAPVAGGGGGRPIR